MPISGKEAVRTSHGNDLGCPIGSFFPLSLGWGAFGIERSNVRFEPGEGAQLLSLLTRFTEVDPPTAWMQVLRLKQKLPFLILAIVDAQ